MAESSAFKVDFELHKENRERLVRRMVDAGANDGVIFLEGGHKADRYDTDHELLFRQESFFQWCVGVKEPDCFLTLRVPSASLTLFIPRLPAEYAVWMGEIKSPSHFKELYGVDEVLFVDELQDWFKRAAPPTVFLLYGQNTDSGHFSKVATFPGMDKVVPNDHLDKETLYPHIVECRTIKSARELQLMRFVNAASSEAHRAVMSQIAPGMREYQAEAIFKYHCQFEAGCRLQAYTCICAAGCAGATLHYGHAGEPNARVMNDGDMVLFDMGAEFHCYASDITCSFPVNGVFTDTQRDIYETVLAASNAVMDFIKPGVSWKTAHEVSERVILEQLTQRGYLQGSVDDMIEHNLAALFQPHGLGHLMGLDTHDCGGYPKGVERAKRAGLRSLRCGRELLENMVLTVEPGCYFIPALLNPALEDENTSKFLVTSKIKPLIGTFGGVRIEDDIIVTANGAENMTNVPRTVAEIEGFMAKNNPNVQKKK